MVSLEGFENVTVLDGTKRTKWHGYEAEMRNRALRPLDRFIKKGEGLGGEIDVVFDKVLILDEVAFDPVEAALLLFGTNVGEDGRARYLAACALGFEGGTRNEVEGSVERERCLRDWSGSVGGRERSAQHRRGVGKGKTSSSCGSRASGI